MTDVTDTTAPARPPEDDAAKAERERPAHRRSIFFDHEARIRALLAEGRSYQQVLRLLGLKKMHRSVLARWCERQGLHSIATPRRIREGELTDKKSASAATPTPTAALASSSPISDALGPEACDEWAEFRKPEDRS